MVLLSDGQDPPQPARIHLTEDTLVLQKEELVYASTDSDSIDPALLAKVEQYTYLPTLLCLHMGKNNKGKYQLLEKGNIGTLSLLHIHMGHWKYS